MWTSGGAVEDIEPTDFSSRFKWRLLKRWFSPDKTIDKKLFSTLDADELGAWARFKKFLLRRWLPTIRVKRKGAGSISMDEMAEQGLISSAPASIRYEPGTINKLAKMSTPVAMADAEPTAVQQLSTMNLRRLSLPNRRRSSAGGSERGRTRSSGERPSSRGSSGVMIEERNLSDTESDAEMGEGARRPSDEGRGDLDSHMRS